MKKNRVAKIVSGGQTGADQGALDAALARGTPCGGWCPKGRKAENGRIPDRFPLVETGDEAWQGRTEMNVRDSHGTVIFSSGPPTGGSLETLNYAKGYQRPCCKADLVHSDEALVGEILLWLKQLPPQPVINAAGSRESKEPGIQERVYCIMKRLLTEEI